MMQIKVVIGRLRNVASQLNNDKFEPTSGLNMSDMICVGSYPILLVESESHQHINPSAKYISTFGLIFLREARIKA